MKKLSAILIAFMLVIAFVSCVDNQGDMAGDVSIPGRETEAPATSESKAETEKKNNNGVVDDNGEVNLPIDYFNN